MSMIKAVGPGREATTGEAYNMLHLLEICLCEQLQRTTSAQCGRGIYPSSCSAATATLRGSWSCCRGRRRRRSWASALATAAGGGAKTCSGYDCSQIGGNAIVKAIEIRIGICIGVARGVGRGVASGVAIGVSNGVGIGIGIAQVVASWR